MGKTIAEFLKDQGKLLGMQELLVEQLRAKFTTLPATIEAKVRAMNDMATLKERGKKLLRARKLSERHFADRHSRSQTEEVEKYSRLMDLYEGIFRDATKSPKRREELEQMRQTMNEILIQQGKELGMQEMLLCQLRAKFSKVPAAIAERVQTTEFTTKLLAWAVELLHARNLAEMTFEHAS